LRLATRRPAFRRVGSQRYRNSPQCPREAALAPADTVIVELTLTQVVSGGVR